MEQLTGTEDRSANCGEKAIENEVEALQLGEEIQRAVMAAAPETGGSFTALLELPANQAMELLHSPGTDEAPGGLDGEVWSKYPAAGTCGLSYLESLHITPMFPSNTALLERASMFSVFAAAAENLPGTSSIPSNSTANSDKVKLEPADSNSNPNSYDPTATNNNQKSTKRKQREKKGKESTKKSKSIANETLEEGEELPYVHVRARRGQATDSHSLAERARREKINARMKLLQELVPGCNKISGTAMVLEEIINHVQCLQRQVEILSMRLATVNPSIDFDLDSLLATEGAFPVDSNFPSVVMPLRLPEGHVNGIRQQYQHLWHFDGLSQPVWGREDNPNFITLENSLLSYNPSMNSASLQANQVKMEL